MSRRKRWGLLACALAVCVIVFMVAAFFHRWGEERSAAEAFCVEAAQQEHPGSAVEVRLTSTEGGSEYTVSGTASDDHSGAVGFTCWVHSDGRNTWGALAGEE